MRAESGQTALSWTERDRATVWHGFTQMDAYSSSSPLIVERADGRYLIDVEGRRYFDGISSLWVNTLGHRVPELDAALRRQLDQIAHSTMLGNGNRVVVELSEALADVLPVEGAHLLFASDGASAVEQALKIAFQFWVNSGCSGRTELPGARRCVPRGHSWFPVVGRRRLRHRAVRSASLHGRPDSGIRGPWMAGEGPRHIGAPRGRRWPRP